MQLIDSLMRLTSIEQPIFIWGAPRSGTTLLYELLAKHPVLGYPQNEEGVPQEGTGHWWHVLGEQRGYIDPETLTKKQIRKIQSSYRTLLRKQAKPRLLDKTPFMVMWVEAVERIFPDAYHIHIIRDGRAVLNSVLHILRHSEKLKHQRFQAEQLMFGPIPLEMPDALSIPQTKRHIQQWVFLVQQGQAARNILGNRYLELRYEDLVSGPQSVMRDVLNYTGLTYDNTLINELSPEALPNRNETWQGAINPEAATPRTVLTKSDMIQIEDEMQPMLKRLGYLCEN